MEKTTNEWWIIFKDEEEFAELKKDKCGKWMHFFNNKEFAEKICKEAVEKKIVPVAKLSNAENGVCCFYLNGDDIARHKKIITFFIENNLIRRTKTGKYYDIAFKFDSQTESMEYGADFTAVVKLSMFINLETGEFLE